MPMPSFADAGIASSPSITSSSSISPLTRGTSAAGKSILLMTGMMVRFCASAR